MTAHAYMHACIHTYMYLCIYTDVLLCMYAYACMCNLVCMHVCNVSIPAISSELFDEHAAMQRRLWCHTC
jgi:hypothetical protein